MARQVMRDAAGRSAERVQYRAPDRLVLVVRSPPEPGRPWHTARLAGPGYVGKGRDPSEVRLETRPGKPRPDAAVASDLAALGFDLTTVR